MEKVRTRDFIYTTDDLFFASTNYLHPEDRYISFLRYIPNPNGDRLKNGKKYSKVDSTESYNYIRENHPEYLYFCENTNKEMMGVPINKVKKIIKPEKRLEEIRESFIGENEIFSKLLSIADFFHFKAGISYENLGISGSILPGLQKKEVSDIDFVIYGLLNHNKAIEAFKKYHNKEIDVNGNTIKLNKVNDDFWEKVYKKRIRDSSLSKDEFFFYEKRKFNRGLIDGTLFDILSTRNYDEVTEKWADVKYEPIGISKIECTIEDALGAYDNPSRYKIKDLKVIEGIDEKITEVVSFTHTYAGEVYEGEKAICKGKVEKVIKNNGESSYQLVVGTTREAIDEYIKLKDFPPK